MTRRNRKPTIQEIRASLTNKPEIRKLLDELPMNDPKPESLLKWARKTFAIGREEKVPDAEITKHVQVFAHQGGWTDKQIANVLDVILA